MDCQDSVTTMLHEGAEMTDEISEVKPGQLRPTKGMARHTAHRASMRNVNDHGEAHRSFVKPRATKASWRPQPWKPRRKTHRRTVRKTAGTLPENDETSSQGPLSLRALASGKSCQSNISGNLDTVRLPKCTFFPFHANTTVKLVFISVSDICSRFSITTRMKTCWGPCPVAIRKNKCNMFCTVSLGEPRILQALDSDVSLSIPRGSRGVYRMIVHTDITVAYKLLSKRECLIAPIVEVHATRSVKKPCELTIPHCVSDQANLRHIEVRKYSQKTRKSHRIQPFGTETRLSIQKKFVKIHTKSFSYFVCTNCNYKTCRATLFMFIFAKLSPWVDKAITTTEIKVFVCCNLYSIKDFKCVSVGSETYRSI